MQKSQVTGVKGNNETNFRTGNVNLTSEDIGSVAVGGDVAENTVAFTSNDAGPDGEYAILSVDKLTTGEKISSIMNKISRIFTNTRYILGLLGTHDITSESVKIGDGTITGALIALNDSLSSKQKKDWTIIVSGLSLGNEATIDLTSYSEIYVAAVSGNMVIPMNIPTMTINDTYQSFYAGMYNFEQSYIGVQIDISKTKARLSLMNISGNQPSNAVLYVLAR